MHGVIQHDVLKESTCRGEEHLMVPNQLIAHFWFVNQDGIESLVVALIHEVRHVLNDEIGHFSHLLICHAIEDVVGQIGGVSFFYLFNQFIRYWDQTVSKAFCRVACGDEDKYVVACVDMLIGICDFLLILSGGKEVADIFRETKEIKRTREQ